MQTHTALPARMAVKSEYWREGGLEAQQNQHLRAYLQMVLIVSLPSLQDTSDRDQRLHSYQEQDHSAVSGAHHHRPAGP